MVGSLEMFHDGRADVALPQANHVRHKGAAVVLDDLHRLAHRHLLKIGQSLRDFVVPQDVLVVLAFEPVAYQGVERLHVNVVGTD